MRVRENRLLCNFSGENAVIGCSHQHSFCSTGMHSNPAAFYSFDFNPQQHPDFLCDITHPLPAKFHNRFKVTLVECLDFSAFNAYDYAGRPTNGAQGFANIMAMTQENGFVLIHGIGKDKASRFCVKDLKYIELADESILIPKNQNLTITQVNALISDNQQLELLIERSQQHQKRPRLHLEFCSDNYNQLPSFVESYKRLAQSLLAKQRRYQAIRQRVHYNVDGKKVFAAIYALKNYARSIISSPEGKEAMSLAKELEQVASNNQLTPEMIPMYSAEYNKLQSEFVAVINANRNSINKHRAIWKPLLANIAIALTGVGTLVIAANLIHSKLSTGKFSFFFDKTHRSELVDNIELNFGQRLVIP